MEYTCDAFTYILEADGTATVTEYLRGAKYRTIPDELDGHPVTGIGSGAFRGKRNMRTVVIPKSVTRMPGNPFIDCPRLESIVLSPEQTNFAMQGNFLVETATGRLVTYLHADEEEEADIPDGIRLIGANAFWGSTFLARVGIPESVTAIGENAFFNCTALSRVDLPQNLTEIGDGAFSYCGALTSANIPSSVTTIGANPFAHCGNLSWITVGAGDPVFAMRSGALYDEREKRLVTCLSAYADTKFAVESGTEIIGKEAFCDCENLTSIHVPQSVRVIGDGAFSGCRNLTKIHVPDGVAAIGAKTFAGCEELTDLHLPDSVTVIGESAFEGCKLLKSFALPRKLARIGKKAFVQCRFLEKLTIPKTVTDIGDDPFGYCRELELSVSPQNPDFMIVDGMLCDRKRGRLLQYLGSDGDCVVPDLIRTIGESAFADIAPDKVVLPEGVTEIGDFAFAWCEFLEEITLPKSLKTIGEGAFNGCGLKSVTLPGSLVSIGEGTFKFCMRLESAVIEEGVTELPEKAFAQCYKLASLTCPASLEDIGWMAVEDDDELRIVAPRDSFAAQIAEENEIPCDFLD